jgi:hypothetical protein
MLSWRADSGLASRSAATRKNLLKKKHTEGLWLLIFNAVEDNFLNQWCFNKWPLRRAAE